MVLSKARLSLSTGLAALGALTVLATPYDGEGWGNNGYGGGWGQGHGHFSPPYNVISESSGTQASGQRESSASSSTGSISLTTFVLSSLGTGTPTETPGMDSSETSNPTMTSPSGSGSTGSNSSSANASNSGLSSPGSSGSSPMTPTGSSPSGTLSSGSTTAQASPSSGSGSHTETGSGMGSTSTGASQSSATGSGTETASGPTSSNSSSSNSSSGSDSQQYLDSTNQVRQQHGAKALTWSDTLASAAQTWANNCQFKHSGGQYGENIYAGSGSQSPSNAVNDWAGEASQYNPSNPQYSHFTQLVWKGTTQLGCVSKTCPNMLQGFSDTVFIVCEYEPAGNVIGQFQQNVQA